MTYITRKKKKGKYYLYLMKDARINGKKKHIIQKYIGPEDRLKNLEISNILSKHAQNVETETMEFGLSAALWQIAKEFNLVRIIDNIAGKSRHQGLTTGEYILLAAINRCVAPCSKSKMENWFKHDWMSTRFDINAATLNAQTYWNHFQYLNSSKIEKIELSVGKQLIEKFDLNIESLLYDPTNFYTYSKGGRGVTGSEILKFGNSKEKRNGKRIAAFWLVCARDSGVPLMHQTYPGNRQDGRIFKTIPDRMAQQLCALGSDPKNITFMFDNGNLSQEGMTAIENTRLKFIASRRPSTHEDLLHKSLDDFTDLFLNVSGKSVKYFCDQRKLYDVERTVYVVFDPKKHIKNVAEFTIKLEKRTQEIQEFFKDRLDPHKTVLLKGAGKKWLKRFEVEKKVKSLIGKAPFRKVIIAHIEGPDEVNPETTEAITLTLHIDQEERIKHEETLGRHIIFTNHKDWPPETVIWAYREQYIVEHAFRYMKCPLCIAIRPMYHHADPCILAHIYICVLSYQLLTLLRLKLRRQHIHMSIQEIVETLKGVKITEIFTSPKTDPILKLNRVEGQAAILVKKLGLKRLVLF
jgi:transposase